MQIIRARTMGMCFGVKDALKMMEKMTSPADVSIHGELVHNPKVLDDLVARGFHLSPEGGRDRLPPTPQVMITAHGVSDKRRAWLKNGGKTLVDTTCPLVRRAHRIALDLATQGYFVLVLGKPDHVEVQGLTEDLPDFRVVNDWREVVCYSARKIGVLCQTTFPQQKAKALLEEIRANNPGKEIRFIDTVCDPTKERQLSVIELIDRVQAMVVVGGHHSNNTRQLVRMSQRAGLPTYHVEGPSCVRAHWFERVQRVGLTAGTSTLEATIDAVHAAIKAGGESGVTNDLGRLRPRS